MIFFYIAFYTITLVTICLRMYASHKAFQKIVILFKKAVKAEGGWRTLLTPWGVERNPEITQIKAFKPMIIAIFVWQLWLYAIFSQIALLFQPGFGLVNSFASGKVYFGALMNYYPLPE